MPVLKKQILPYILFSPRLKRGIERISADYPYLYHWGYPVIPALLRNGRPWQNISRRGLADTLVQRVANFRLSGLLVPGVIEHFGASGGNQRLSWQATERLCQI